MNLPTKPEFHFNNINVKYEHRICSEYHEYITKKDFDEWYDEVFKGALTVYKLDENPESWSHIIQPTRLDFKCMRALLINITPIVKDTIEQEIIRSMVEYIEGDYPRMESTAHGNHSNELIRKARAYLDAKK